MVYLYALFLIVPMYFIVITALKSNQEVTTNPLGLPSQFMFSNFVDAFVKGNMARYSINSIILTVFTVAGVLLNSTIVTFGIYKLFNRKLGVVIYSAIIATMMIPGCGWVSQIILYRQLHLYNNLHGLIIGSVATGLAFNVFILLGFMRSLPKELEDASRIDGCSDMQHLFYIMVPLIKPALITLGIFTFVGSWNGLFGPLLMLKNKNLFTIPIGLMAFRGTYSVEYNLMFAAVLIAGVPLVLVYLKFQKYFVEALAGGIKG
jgi:raffinose/stachyose/melibiose transport system permease protein